MPELQVDPPTSPATPDPQPATAGPPATPRRFVRPRYWFVAYFSGGEALDAGRQHVFRSRKRQRAKLIAARNMPPEADRMELAEIGRREFHRRREKRTALSSPMPPNSFPRPPSDQKENE